VLWEQLWASWEAEEPEAALSCDGFCRVMALPARAHPKGAMLHGQPRGLNLRQRLRGNLGRAAGMGKAAESGASHPPPPPHAWSCGDLSQGGCCCGTSILVGPPDPGPAPAPALPCPAQLKHLQRLWQEPAPFLHPIAGLPEHAKGFVAASVSPGRTQQI